MPLTVMTRNSLWRTHTCAHKKPNQQNKPKPCIYDPALNVEKTTAHPHKKHLQATCTMHREPILASAYLHGKHFTITWISDGPSGVLLTCPNCVHNYAMRPSDQKLGSSLVPSAKLRPVGRNPRSGRCSGLHLVGLLLQLLVSLHINRPCFHWKWKTTDWRDLYTAMLPRSRICFNKRRRFEHWVFRVLSTHILSTNKTETKAKICLHPVCVYVSVGVMHVR